MMEPCRILVLDMQPILPSEGGARLRLRGLYHGTGRPTTYVGTYDWPGEPCRRQFVTPSLEEILVPLSAEHFAAASAMRERAGGTVVIDVCFHQLAEESPAFMAAVREHLPQADAVIFSHPWIYPLVKNEIDWARQVVIYDAHNVEGYLRTLLLDDGGAGSEMAREVARIEYELCQDADLVLACSREDVQLFERLYELPPERCRIVPNAVFVGEVTPPAEERKAALKRELGLPDRPTGIFIGSYYTPNVDAARFLAFTLAPQIPDVTVVIAGGVGEGELQTSVLQDGPPNVVITGRLSDAQKLAYLQAADFALNPMTGGSGTNVKMFDFMAAGLCCLSTRIGARGIETSEDGPVVLAECGEMLQAVRALVDDPVRRRRLGAKARALACEAYSFERISAELGTLVEARVRRLRLGRAPRVSVIVPTYGRHERLSLLCERLSRQRFRDFEVLIVDQTPTPWAHAGDDFGIDLTYVRTDVRGPAHARNLGAHMAGGEILAFTDDDCLPYDDWLANAATHFGDPRTVGIEGLVKSDRVDPEKFRTTTNEFSELQGYLTANLCVRSRTFHAVGGFDARFDNFDKPYREDTDFGWRAAALGPFPFRTDVVVYHPPHSRDVARESLEARNQFFENDALLFRKHSERAVELIRQEGHFLREDYWDTVQRGCAKYGVDYLDFRQSVEAGFL